MAALVGILALAAAVYVGMRWQSLPPSLASASSIDNLEITQLTSTGNAERPAISPDGKYVAAATTKVKLRANGHPADYYCGACDHFFDARASTGYRRKENTRVNLGAFWWPRA